MSEDERFHGYVEATLEAIHEGQKSIRKDFDHFMADSTESRRLMYLKLEETASGLAEDHRALRAKVDEHIKHDDKRFIQLWKYIGGGVLALLGGGGLATKFFGG